LTPEVSPLTKSVNFDQMTGARFRGPRDFFVVPSWKSVVHEAADEAVLFSFSDRPVQEARQPFREERHDA
jgi:gentisate 1,2-dioxygenase